jgi:trimethylamine:corrinoid methyltransferase-like protein
MQSGAESMLFMLSAFNAGYDMRGGLGSCYNANGVSSEWIVIGSAWFEAAKYLTKGISLEYLTKGLDSIKAQKYGGHFLTEDLTVELLRSGEFFSSDIFDLSGGYRDGAPSMLEKAHEKVCELTADYVSPVPGDIQEKLCRYFSDRYKKLSV